MKILIVDDQSSARMLLRMFLEDVGPDVQIEDFHCPLSALAWCKAHTPDVIVIDYEMPEMDGLKFTRELRSQTRLQDVPLIIVTVVMDDAVRVAVLEEGADEILNKPINPREIKARVTRLVHMRQRLKRAERALAEMGERGVAAL